MQVDEPPTASQATASDRPGLYFFASSHGTSRHHCNLEEKFKQQGANLKTYRATGGARYHTVEKELFDALEQEKREGCRLHVRRFQRRQGHGDQ